MADAYKSLSEAGRAHGVTPQAAARWRKHPKFPCKSGSLNKLKLDRFVRDWIAPKRKTPPAVPPPAAAPTVSAEVSAPVVPEASDPPPDGEWAPDDLDDIGRSIKASASTADADHALKRIRAYRLWREEQERQGKLVNVETVRNNLAAALSLFKAAALNVPETTHAKLEGLSSLEIKTVLDGEMIKLLAGLKQAIERAGGSST